MHPTHPSTLRAAPQGKAFERHLAVDLHKYYVVVGEINAQQEVVLPPRRLDPSTTLRSEWSTWGKKHLKPTDALVIEFTTNAWDFYDEVVPLVGRAVVANPG